MRGFTGFGFALAAVPLAILVLPPRLAVAAVLLMQAGIGLRDCLVERRIVDWAAVQLLTLGSLVGTPLGLLALSVLPQAIARLVLGVLVLAAVGVTWRPARPRSGSGRGWALLAGVVAGLGNGLAAMSGPPTIVYFLTFEPDRAVMRASMLAFFPLAALFGLPAAAFTGLLSRDAAIIAATGLPLMLVGGWLGAALFRRSGHRSYRVIAVVTLSVTALLSIGKGLAGLLP